jgi:hypothetical protein
MDLVKLVIWGKETSMETEQEIPVNAMLTLMETAW